MAEIALNVPFDAPEIIEIAIQEFRKRLQGLSPLQSNKEYVAFSIDFHHTIRLRRSGETVAEARETLAWGKVEKGDLGIFDPEHPDMADEVLSVEESFKSKDPNDERVARDMALTVETSDGRGGKIRKKVKVKA